MADAFLNWPMEQIAKALDLPTATVDRWIRQGRIPVRRKGLNCMFNRAALEKWAAAHGLHFTPPGPAADQTKTEIPATLVAAMGQGGVHHGIKGNSVDQILRSAVECLAFLKPEAQMELHKGLLERESLASTGIGRGVAVPHPRAPLTGVITSPTITTCFLQTPLAYGAVDEKPVFVLFVLVSKTIQEHLRLLSRLSYCLRNDEFNRFLKTVPAAEALLGRVGEFERQLDLGEHEH